MNLRVIAASQDLLEGAALRFSLQRETGKANAFAIRYQGRVYAYLNECAHLPVELDQNPGHFFDASGHYLLCSMHGAYFSPTSGQCLEGPCKRPGLLPLFVEEIDGQICLKEE